VTGMTRDVRTLVLTRTLTPGSAHPAVVRTSIAAATRATDEEVLARPRPDGVPRLDGWVLVHEGAPVVGAWSYLHETAVASTPSGPCPRCDAGGSPQHWSSTSSPTHIVAVTGPPHCSRPR
jgi:hypothetical protein